MSETIQKLVLDNGVNQLVDDLDIGDDELVSTKNLWPSVPGSLSKRMGLGFREWDSTAMGSLATHTFTPNALANTPDALRANGVRYVYGVLESGVQTFHVYRTGGNRSTDPYFIAPVAGPYTPVLFTAQDKLFCLTGANANAPGCVFAASGGSPFYKVDPWSFDAGNGFGANQAVSYRNRTVYLALTGALNRMVWSDIEDPFTLGSNAYTDRTFVLGNHQGERLVTGVEVMPTGGGSVGQSSLLVFTETSTWMVTGEPGPSTAATAADITGTVAFAHLAVDTGCVAPRTIVRTPFGVIWVGHDNVWMFSQGQLPTPIGAPIKSLLKNTPAASRHLMFAEYFNGTYRLAIGAPGQDFGPISGMDEQYWLDLRNYDGRPRWYGPQIHRLANEANGTRKGMHFLHTDTRADGQKELISLENVWPGGTTNFENPTFVTYDQERGFDSAAGNLAGVNLDLPYRAPIETEITSKRYTFGDMMIDKTYIGMEMSLQHSTGLNVQIDTLLSGTTVVQSDKTWNLEEGFLLDYSTLDDTYLTQEYVASFIAPDPTLRYQGKTLQFVIRDRPGWVLQSEMSPMVFTVGENRYSATLTPGYYADIDALMTHILGQMNAQDPGLSFTYVNTVAGDGGTIINTDAWIPLWYSGGDSMKRLAAFLGFENVADPVAATHQQNQDTYWPAVVSSSIAYGDILVRYNPIPRRPL